MPFAALDGFSGVLPQTLAKPKDLPPSTPAQEALSNPCSDLFERYVLPYISALCGLVSGFDIQWRASAARHALPAQHWGDKAQIMRALIAGSLRASWKS